MKMLLPLVLLSLCTPSAFADGLSPMELKDVLPLADVVVVAEIVSNDGTVVEKKNGQDVTAVQYAYRIKFTVIRPPVGRTGAGG